MYGNKYNLYPIYFKCIWIDNEIIESVENKVILKKSCFSASYLNKCDFFKTLHVLKLLFTSELTMHCKFNDKNDKNMENEINT